MSETVFVTCKECNSKVFNFGKNLSTGRAVLKCIACGYETEFLVEGDSAGPAEIPKIPPQLENATVTETYTVSGHEDVMKILNQHRQKESENDSSRLQPQQRED